MSRTNEFAEVAGAEITRYASATGLKTSLRAELGDALVQIEIKVEVPGRPAMTLEQVQMLCKEMASKTLTLLRPESG